MDAEQRKTVRTHREQVTRAGLEADPGGRVAHIRGEDAVPNMRVRVRAGQHVRVPDEHENHESGDYFEGSELDMEGPTAYHLEELGFVDVVGLGEGKSAVAVGREDA